MLDIGNIPRRDDDTTRIGTLGDEIHRLLNLVDSLAIWSRPRAPLIAIDVVQVAKLVALDGREDTLLCGTQELLHSDGQYALLDAEFVVVEVGIVIPDVYPIVDEVLDVGVAIEEPQQLVDNALEEDLLGGQQWKALREVEAHLMSEDALGTRSCAVGLNYALILNSSQALSEKALPKIKEIKGRGLWWYFYPIATGKFDEDAFNYYKSIGAIGEISEQDYKLMTTRGDYIGLNHYCCEFIDEKERAMRHEEFSVNDLGWHVDSTSIYNVIK